MTKPKKAEKPKKEEESRGKSFDEIMGALLKVPKKGRKKKQTTSARPSV